MAESYATIFTHFSEKGRLIIEKRANTDLSKMESLCTQYLEYPDMYTILQKGGFGPATTSASKLSTPCLKQMNDRKFSQGYGTSVLK